MISGFATREGTARFASRYPGIPAQNYRVVMDLTLSNVGVGTYLGQADSHTDTLVTTAIKESIKSGINVIDTAINYRAQKAERSVGKALSELVDADIMRRDEIFVSTKNGYVTDDADLSLDFWEYIRQEYTLKGTISAGDISSGYHCMSIRYLEDQLDRSLQNLGLDCIDLMYLHNGVEGQIKDIPMKDFEDKLSGVFEMYEQKRDEGKIRYYGMATWESFRSEPDAPAHLPLDRILSMARQAGGDNHGFRFIQLPFNLYYDQALLRKNHVLQDRPVSVLEAARHHGIGVFSSVPFMQGRLLKPGVMPEFGSLSPNLRALQFIRSAPGITAPLVGHKTPEHVQANLKIMQVTPLGEEEFAVLLKQLTS